MLALDTRLVGPTKKHGFDMDQWEFHSIESDREMDRKNPNSRTSIFLEDPLDIGPND